MGERSGPNQPQTVTSARRPIAVILDGPPTPAWQARALAGLEAVGTFEVVELRLVAGARRGLAERLHAAGERHFFVVGPDPHAPIRLPEQAGRASQAALVVWLAERPPPEDETRELISLLHEGRAEPVEHAFRRALLSGRHCVVSEVVLRAQSRSLVVGRTVSATGPASELASRTRALWKLADLLPRAVGCLPGLDEPTSASHRRDSPPAAARLLMRDAASWVRAPAARFLFRRPWQIRVRERGESPTRGWEQEDCLVRWGDARLYADPFIFEHDGCHHLFCEEVSRGSKQGVISHTQLHLDGTPADAPEPVLRASYHISYPCVFAHEGEIFMIPETSVLSRIELHRAVSFPDSWQLEAILVEDISAVDATFFEHGGRLWLFAAVAAEGASHSDELHLFSADTLLGPWRAHPRNPVVSDVRGARPAGAIQRWGPRIVRPAQDCSRRYGWALSLREIDILSEEEYAEREVDRLEPLDLEHVRGVHTYAADSRFEAIDVRQREPRLRRRRDPPR